VHMLLRLKQTGAAVDVEEVSPVLFASVPINSGGNATESHLEAMIASNVELFVNPSDEDEGPTLLVIGRQVRTKTNRRMDLVALDGTGGLTLIEVKRDASDVGNRADHAEIQAVRYAASLGKLKTEDDLVAALYARYVERYEGEQLKLHGGGRSAEEWARKRLTEFIRKNGIDGARLNHTQNVVLIGASFDSDTISAAAWMAKNGLPFRVIQVEPRRIADSYFLDVKQLIPVPAYEDFYVDVTVSSDAPPASKTTGGSSGARAYRIRLPALVEAGRLKAGDTLIFKIDPTRPAKLKGPNTCEFEGKDVSLLDWTKQVSGWAAVNIYDWVIHQPTGKLLEEIRVELEEELATKPVDAADAITSLPPALAQVAPGSVSPGGRRGPQGN
jgi:hypothetical protein